MRGNTMGLVIGAVFGLIYVLVNAVTFGAPVGPALQVLGVAAFAGLLVVLYRSRHDADDTTAGAVRFGRGYWFVVAAEVVGAFAGIAVLNGPLDLPLAVLPWVTLVVGVHFLGLAKAWTAPSLTWLGAGMSVCGAGGLAAALAAPAPVIATIAGIAPGALLLAGSWWAATRSGART